MSENFCRCCAGLPMVISLPDPVQHVAAVTLNSSTLVYMAARVMSTDTPIHETLKTRWAIVCAIPEWQVHVDSYRKPVRLPVQ